MQPQQERFSLHPILDVRTKDKLPIDSVLANEIHNITENCNFIVLLVNKAYACWSIASCVVLQCTCRLDENNGWKKLVLPFRVRGLPKGIQGFFFLFNANLKRTAGGIRLLRCVQGIILLYCCFFHPLYSVRGNGYHRRNGENTFADSSFLCSWRIGRYPT